MYMNSDAKKKETNNQTDKKMNPFQLMQEKFIKSVTARLTVAQVVKNVESGSELTFDFVIYVIMAAWIAAIGLIDNSLVCLVASMLVSPLMVLKNILDIIFLNLH